MCDLIIAEVVAERQAKLNEEARERNAKRNPGTEIPPDDAEDRIAMALEAGLPIANH